MYFNTWGLLFLAIYTNNNREPMHPIKNNNIRFCKVFI